jgi:hypothetical protein
LDHLLVQYLLLMFVEVMVLLVVRQALQLALQLVELGEGMQQH